MSRHRLVRNMNIQDELELDEDIDEGGEAIYPQKITVQRLADGLERIRATIGPMEQSGITNEEIKDALYHYYYDVAESLNGFSVKEQTRRHAAQERRGERPSITIYIVPPSCSWSFTPSSRIS
ncbi:hypothetical protein BC629DRAFT_1545313 [Irpex lacteus]|nr:hypothetical protein BC629DRAFT_1545313 [Irpex lacteus]